MAWIAECLKYLIQRPRRLLSIRREKLLPSATPRAVLCLGRTRLPVFHPTLSAGSRPGLKAASRFSIRTERS